MMEEKEEAFSLYVGNKNGRILAMETATLDDVLDAIELARSSNGVMTYAPSASAVLLVQLLEFGKEVCKVYVVLDEDDGCGKVTRLNIEDAVLLVEQIYRGETPDRTGWSDNLDEDDEDVPYRMVPILDSVDC